MGKQGSIIVEANKRILVKKQNDTEIEETIEEDTSYRNEFEDFYQAIRNGKEVVSSFSKAYEDLYVLLTALDSANQFHDLVPESWSPGILDKSIRAQAFWQEKWKFKSQKAKIQALLIFFFWFWFVRVRYQGLIYFCYNEKEKNYNRNSRGWE